MTEPDFNAISEEELRNDPELSKDMKDFLKWKKKMEADIKYFLMHCGKCGLIMEFDIGASLAKKGWESYVIDNYRTVAFCPDCKHP